MTSPTKPDRSGWIPVSAVALSTFAVVTTEMLRVGLIAAIAEELRISIGIVGLMISLPAILAAVFAPAVVIAAGNLDRKPILAGLLVRLILANFASGVAPTIG